MEFNIKLDNMGYLDIFKKKMFLYIYIIKPFRVTKKKKLWDNRSKTLLYNVIGQQSWSYEHGQQTIVQDLLQS